MDDVLSLLDRQVAALHAQVSGADFLVSVEPMLRALRGEPRLAVHLEDLQDEALDRIRVFEGVDAELVPVLVDLRNRLVVLDPGLTIRIESQRSTPRSTRVGRSRSPTSTRSPPDRPSPSTIEGTTPAARNS